MSLAAEEENSKWYCGEGIGGTYSIPFRFREASWLRVTIIHADNSSAEIGTTDFTLTGDSALGTAVLKLSNSVAPPATSKVIISRLAPSTQNLSLSPNAPLPAKDLETALDHLAMAIRDRDSDHKQTASKALLFPVGEPNTHNTRLPLPQQRKGFFLGFHDTTGEMQVRPISTALHNIINQANAAITAALDTIASGLATLESTRTATLTAIENARTTTVTVLNNTLAMGTELLAKIPLFYKASEGGGIKFGNVFGYEAGGNAINLQSYRAYEWQIASGHRSIVIGSSEAPGEDSLAIGNNSSAGYWTSTIGVGNQATFDAGAAFGYRNSITGARGVAIGNDNVVQAYQSAAIGGSNNVSGQFASTFGYANMAGGNDSLAIGYRNATDYELTSAVGVLNFASGSRSSAFGYGNGATSDYSSSFGYSNHATGNYATAVGAENAATSARATAIGCYNNVSADSSAAMGRRNTISGWYSTAIGQNNSVTGSSSAAFGTGNSVGGPEACAIGLANQIFQDRSAAFGRYNYVTSFDAAAIGFFNSVTSYNSIAFGYATQVGTPFVTEMGNMSFGAGARVRADAWNGSVGLSFGYMTPPPTYMWGYSPGSEPSGTLGNNMLSFRSDGDRLFIDVCVGNWVRTITLPLS